MEYCIDSALCGYGFMLKSSDFHNGNPLSKNSALQANIEFELEMILSVQVVFQLSNSYTMASRAVRVLLPEPEGEGN